ncbi:MAG: hypothetical protein CL579_03435 [Alteromonadaceae bacterium]|nr:hypothetical protein [Alteromonadaceae bacterium]MBB19951.1 hypothetical protein [Rickettsiales bacterium]
MYIKPSKYKAYTVKIKITCMFIALYWLFPTKIGVNGMLSDAIIVFYDVKILFFIIYVFTWGKSNITEYTCYFLKAYSASIALQ